MKCGNEIELLRPLPTPSHRQVHKSMHRYKLMGGSAQPRHDIRNYTEGTVGGPVLPNLGFLRSLGSTCIRGTYRVFVIHTVVCTCIFGRIFCAHICDSCSINGLVFDNNNNNNNNNTVPNLHASNPGVSSRAKTKAFFNANRNERSRGCSLLHDHGAFSTSLISPTPNLNS